MTWTKEGKRWLGRFEGEVPSGAHRLQLELEPTFAWRGPRSFDGPQSGEELRFTIDDSGPLVDIYLGPVAAEDERPLLSYSGEAVIESGDTIGGDDMLSPSFPIVTGHPRSVPFEWQCFAPGRRVVCGRFEPDDGQGDIVIPVVLERGPGLEIFVGDGSGYGLAGVRVFADGVPAGITSPCGMLCLDGEPPEHLAFVYEDWSIDPDWGDVEPDGTFEVEGDWGISVFLVPPRPR